MASGNIGTTNALRTMGKVGGGAVFVLDFGKGIVSGLIAAAAAAAFGGGMSLLGPRHRLRRLRYRGVFGLHVGPYLQPVVGL